MTVYRVEVDVALDRPPRTDATVRVVVDAGTAVDAELTACQIAECDRRVVMAVGSRILTADTSDSRATD